MTPPDRQPGLGRPLVTLDLDAMSMTLTADAAAVRQARVFARECCTVSGVGSDASDTVVLLTSELVTNAFVHGRSDARLSVTTSAGLVRVEVGDDNCRQPRHVERDDDALDGRGLWLLAGLAHQWGVREELVGKTVWFEVRL